jgi:hypothetical protein
MTFFADTDFAGQRVRNNSFMPKKISGLDENVAETVLDSFKPINQVYVHPDNMDIYQKIDEYKTEVAAQSLSIFDNLSNTEESSKLNTEELGDMVRSLKSKIKHLNTFIKKSRYQGEEDELNNLIGCILTFTTVFLLGSSPCKHYFYWLAFVEIAMYFNRYWYYSQIKYQYFLIDL